MSPAVYTSMAVERCKRGPLFGSSNFSAALTRVAAGCQSIGYNHRSGDTSQTKTPENRSRVFSIDQF